MLIYVAAKRHHALNVLLSIRCPPPPSFDLTPSLLPDEKSRTMLCNCMAVLQIGAAVVHTNAWKGPAIQERIMGYVQQDSASLLCR